MGEPTDRSTCCSYACHPVNISTVGDGIGVWVGSGVEVGIGVLVGVDVIVGDGVIVGPNTCPRLHDEINIVKIKICSVNDFFIYP